MIFNSDEYLIPIALATGAPTLHEAMLLLAYRGIGIIRDPNGKEEYLSLTTAIRWNETEAEDSEGAEKKFRTTLAAALKEIRSNDHEFIYSDELMSLWAKVFPQAAHLVLKSQSAKVSLHIKVVIREALGATRKL